MAQIIIKDKLCKQCGYCIEFCPKDVFTADEFGNPIVTFPDRCSVCYLCVKRCPDLAVTVEGGKVDG